MFLIRIAAYYPGGTQQVAIRETLQDAMDFREMLVALGYPCGVIMEICKGKVLEVRSHG